MQTIELNKKAASIEVADDKIIINLEQKYVPKDGEYFYVRTQSNYQFFAIKQGDKNITGKYCSVDIGTMRYGGSGVICDDCRIAAIRPATEGEKDLLNKALEERGKKWNPETKQIEGLPKEGDFCIFWINDKSRAICGILQKLNPHDYNPYYMNYGNYFKNCIPFQSVEHFKEFIKGSDK